MLRAGGSRVTQKCRGKDVKVMVGPAELVLHKVLTATASSAMTHPRLLVLLRHKCRDLTELEKGVEMRQESMKWQRLVSVTAETGAFFF